MELSPSLKLKFSYPYILNLYYFKLRFFDLTESIV